MDANFWSRFAFHSSNDSSNVASHSVSSAIFCLFTLFDEWEEEEVEVEEEEEENALLFLLAAA